MVQQLTAFVLTCLVVVLVPGPDFALVLRNATRGPRSAATAAAGIMVGNTILALLAVLGITALLGASEVLGTGIRIAGAAYLLYLGVRALAEAFDRKPKIPNQPAARAAGRQLGGRSPFVQGMVSNLLNPKVAVFYLSLFPQFNFAPLPPLAQHAAMACIFLLIALAWYVLLLCGLKRVTGFLARPRTSRMIVGGSGAVLVGVGGTILTKTLISA
ncbi:LysE family translocator [Arthrobacter oryzae]|uniref:Threonine/homoserine/homoserine lactone efflux protein n=1 Tax=Arthrobacter oryzae TaxID=409290 RepID=A0A495FML9_9MICC|nr:LysE family translocator [Arthrobacter oryzae]RKR30470.1 threonine/homoserine/homoserine lactone efflux protein [Arthrobacter oryzae]